MLGKYRRQHLLGGGFARRAGDLHHGDVKFSPIPACQAAQSGFGIIHSNIKLAGLQIFGNFGAQAPGGPLLQGHVYVGVAVEALTHQGHKEVAGENIPAVGADPGDGGALLQEASVCGGGDLPGRAGNHHSRSAFLTRRDSSAIFSHRAS